MKNISDVFRYIKEHYRIWIDRDETVVQHLDQRSGTWRTIPNTPNHPSGYRFIQDGKMGHLMYHRIVWMLEHDEPIPEGRRIVPINNLKFLGLGNVMLSRRSNG